MRWRAVYIDTSTTTPLALAAGILELPRILYEAPGSTHYPLTWCKSEAAAVAVLADVRSVLGA